MPRGRTTPRPAQPKPEDVIEWREPPAKGNADGLSWSSVLTPLLKKQGQWAMIRDFDTPEKAASAQSNLAARRVSIPQPEHDWSFASRGIELFACYHGRMTGAEKPPPKKRPAASANGKTAASKSKTKAAGSGKAKTTSSKTKTSTSKTKGRTSGRSVR